MKRPARERPFTQRRKEMEMNEKDIMWVGLTLKGIRDEVAQYCGTTPDITGTVNSAMESPQSELFAQLVDLHLIRILTKNERQARKAERRASRKSKGKRIPF